MKFEGRAIINGKINGKSLVSKQALNFLAAYSKNLSIFWIKYKITDKNHELYKRDIRNYILFIPCSSGSTSGGVFLMEAIRASITPKAIVVENADSLLASGGILAEIWIDKKDLPPIIECSSIFREIKSNMNVNIDGNTIEINE